LETLATSVRTFKTMNYFHVRAAWRQVAIAWFIQRHDTKLCFISCSSTTRI